MAKRTKAERRADRQKKKTNRQDTRATRKETRVSNRTERKASRATNRDDRREDREDRIAARGKKKADKILARKSVKLAKVAAKSEAGYWSPEAIALRQDGLSNVFSEVGDLGGDVLGAFGFGDGDPEVSDITSQPYTEDFVGAGLSSPDAGLSPPADEDEDEDQEVSIMDEVWFWPAVGIVGLGAVYYWSESQ